MVQGVLGGAELGHEVLGRLTGEDGPACPSPKLGGLVPWRVWLQVHRAKLSQGWFTFRVMVRRPLRDRLRKTNRRADLCRPKKPLPCNGFLLPGPARFPAPCLPRDSRLYGTPPGLRLVGFSGLPEGSGSCVDGQRPGRGRPEALARLASGLFAP
jgi:hypothetical protein